ncbi:MAG: glycosyltransferase family 2 protein [Candidatus Bathyarchaeia archaeon]
MECRQELPKVSFVIPTFNSARTIGRCLESVAKQDYSNLEIVVIDGGSKDATIHECSKFTDKVFIENGPLGKARQTGVEKSTGDILAIFDSDIILPSPYWLQQAIKPFQKHENIGVVWPVNRAPSNGSIVAKCYFGFWNERLLETKNALPGGNSLISREAVERVGGFNTRVHFGEDFDLINRILCSGYKVAVFRWPIIHDSMHTLKVYTRKQMWGASSLLKTKSTPGDSDLLYQCITWDASNQRSSRGAVLKGIVTSQIIGGFKSMIFGMAKRKQLALAIFPLLLCIRTGVYGLYFARMIASR